LFQFAKRSTEKRTGWNRKDAHAQTSDILVPSVSSVYRYFYFVKENTTGLYDPLSKPGSLLNIMQIFLAARTEIQENVQKCF